MNERYVDRWETPGAQQAAARRAIASHRSRSSPEARRRDYDDPYCQQEVFTSTNGGHNPATCSSGPTKREDFCPQWNNSDGGWSTVTDNLLDEADDFPTQASPPFDTRESVRERHAAQQDAQRLEHERMLEQARKDHFASTAANRDAYNEPVVMDYGIGFSSTKPKLTPRRRGAPSKSPPRTTPSPKASTPPQRTQRAAKPVPVPAPASYVQSEAVEEDLSRLNVRDLKAPKHHE